MIVHIDQVTVQELLGEGTFAKVFKATLREEKSSLPVSYPLYATANVHCNIAVCRLMLAT